MKVWKSFLVLLLITLPSLAGARGRLSTRQGRGRFFPSRQAYDQSGTVVLDLSYDFSVPGETHRISFVVVLPENIPDRQRILSAHYSPKPTRIFHKNGNRYAEFAFVEPKERARVRIRIKAELFGYDLLTAMKKRNSGPLEEEELADFLIQERYIEKDHDLIKEIADGIEGRTETELVSNIYDYVIDHMEYANPSRSSRGAVAALERGKGDCTEYADLFVAVCRAKGIPARVVTGYTVRFDAESPKHNWVEVYLQQYGWVPFDPSTGDIEHPVIRGRAFSRMRPVYIYLSHLRNDEVLGDYSFGAYAYRGDKPRFKESVDFKFLLLSIP